MLDLLSLSDQLKMNILRHAVDGHNLAVQRIMFHNLREI